MGGKTGVVVVVPVGIIALGAAILAGCPNEANERDIQLTCPASTQPNTTVDLKSLSNKADGVRWNCVSSDGADFALVLNGVETRSVAGKASVTAPARALQSQTETVVQLKAYAAGNIQCQAETAGPDPVSSACFIKIDPEAGAPFQTACLPLTDFSGDWHSVYSCNSSTGAVNNGEFDVTITQNNDLAQYTDDGITFSGKVCNNVWTFSATFPAEGDAGIENENGTLTMISPGKAERKSVWKNAAANGTCTDTFTKK